ncbi:hypothetical protein [Pseudoxanthomonas mexicana]|jgi:hypothetical protein|uniref:hypothetical protein n=1 Tax=Pseudoxanthomonas mexicana TaxID=128785 RepID=UPI0007834786|nr:hypothetical protein [Pseudoxanthomonas mexicana]
MEGKSAAIVGFIANLTPLYDGERVGAAWAARSLQDGTLLLPVDESEWDEERGTVLVRWQGDPMREQQVEGTYLATLAVVRYVELHHLGQPAEHVAAVLQHLSQHFQFKTGCDLYLPETGTSPDLVDAVSGAVRRLGADAVSNLLLRTVGL